nr:photosynthetic NDH subunit of subcomplex B 3, chloroplastic [Tanacetum cinerariifolium]
MTTLRDGQPEAAPSQEPPCVNFAFVSSVLLPDGTPDVHFRNATGGQKLRDIMLDSNIELYGPYSRPLLNCAGGGTCATCMVEVIEGKELLSPRTDKEKEKLNRNPKNWRLACQTTVGKPDSTGMVVIQQLPEWKGHEWTLGKEPPPES